MTRSRLYSGCDPGYSPLMAPLVPGAESGGTIERPGKLAASGRSLQTCNRDPTRSQFALVRSDARRRLPARNQQRRFCRPVVGTGSVKSRSLELEEDHDTNLLTHNLTLGIHLRTCTASPEPFGRLSEGEGNKQGIWRPHAAVINHEDSDVSVCPTTQAQARNSDSATTEPTYAQLYSKPSLGLSSPCPSQMMPDTCIMPFDPHTPDTTFRFEDFVNFTPTELQAR
jgi:hypothetical protein